LAALLWLVTSILFSWYAGNFGNCDKTYGSLGAAVGLMTCEVIKVPERCEQSCQVPASVEHPGFHGILRKVKDLGDLFDRLLVPSKIFAGLHVDYFDRAI
jgi:hypothetical protein